MFKIYIKKYDGEQKFLRGALIKSVDFLWTRKMLFQCGMLSPKWSCLQKKTFSLKRKNNVWGSFSEPIEILFIFCRIFGEPNEEKRGSNTARKMKFFIKDFFCKCCD